MEVWSHRPQGRVLESLAWVTDVVACKAVEKRYSVGPLPRQTLAFEHQMSAREYGLARQKADKVGGDPLYIPYWPALVEIPGIYPGTASIPVDASHVPSYKVGGALLIWEEFDHCEVCTISAIGTGTISISATVNSYTYPTVVPLRVGTFAQPWEGNRTAASYNKAQVVFVVTATESMVDSSAVAYADYAGHPLVTAKREEINSLDDKVVRELDTLDSRIGPLINYPTKNAATLEMSIAITAQTPAELLSLRSFLASLRGRWKAFWLPSWNADFVMTSSISAGNTYIQVETVDFVANYGIGAHVAVITTAGSFVCIQVTSVSTDGLGSERLHFAGAFSGGLDLAFVDRVCLLTLSRLDADRIEFQFEAGLAVTVVVPTVEVPE